MNPWKTSKKPVLSTPRSRGRKKGIVARGGAVKKPAARDVAKLASFLILIKITIYDAPCPMKLFRSIESNRVKLKVSRE